MNRHPTTYTCVGSGTCVPRPERGPACHLVEHRGLRIALDLGAGSLRALSRLGCPPRELAAVGLTHRHQDHVADLLPLLFALRHDPDEPRVEPLVLFGYGGLGEDLRRLAAVFGGWVLAPGFPLEVGELPAGAELALGGGALRVSSHVVRHSAEAVGFRLELREGPVLAYSGDSGPTPALAELASGADLFVCECAFPDGHGVEVHLTPSELLPLAAESRTRHVVATHFYPIWDRLGVEPTWEAARRRWDADAPPVTPAVDGLRVDLGRIGSPPAPDREEARC